MSDQAARLRTLAAQNRYQAEIDEIAESGSAKTIAVTSGKGGVGKSNVSLNLAIAFAQSGNRVLLIDADLNLANLDILLGITPAYTIRDVVNGSRLLQEVLIQCRYGFDLLPANSGALDLWNIDKSVTAPLFQQLAAMEALYDFVIIDTAAGISPYVIDFTASAHEILVVTLPEPTSMMDAYAVIKLTSRQVALSKTHDSRIRVVMNQVIGKDEAPRHFRTDPESGETFSRAARRAGGDNSGRQSRQAGGENEKAAAHRVSGMSCRKKPVCACGKVCPGSGVGRRR